MIHYTGIDSSEPARGHGGHAATEPEPSRLAPLTRLPAHGFAIWFILALYDSLFKKKIKIWPLDPSSALAGSWCWRIGGQGLV